MREKGNTDLNEFDGEAFPKTLIVIAVVVLLIFGSTDIEDLTDAP